MASNSQMLQQGHQAILTSEARSVDGSLTNDPTYQKLRQYHNQNAAKLNMSEMFASESNRFDKFQ